MSCCGRSSSASACRPSAGAQPRIGAAIGEHVLDREPDAGEGRLTCSELLPDALTARYVTLIRHVSDVVGVNDLVDSGHLLLTADLVARGLDHSLALYC